MSTFIDKLITSCVIQKTFHFNVVNKLPFIHTCVGSQTAKKIEKKVNVKD